MSDWMKSIVREIAQKLVGTVALWLVAPGVDVPKEVTDWAILALVGGALVVWTAVVRFLETRDPATAGGKLAHLLARILMLGIATKPTYREPAGAR